MPSASAITIEKSIRALVLLERLAASGLRFVFKGGTCMMLHMQDLRRLSVDIDIVCTEGLPRLQQVLDQIARQPPFENWDEHKRPPDRRPKRKHFRLYYTSQEPQNPEPYVFLDVVTEPFPTPFAEQKEILAPFIESDIPPLVKVPTINGLLGDKLTAFAPETVGIRYAPKLSQQIIKQMFDVGELFQVAADLDKIGRAHEESFKAENDCRRKKSTLSEALEDTLHTAYRVSQLNLAHEERWDGTKRRMLLEGISAINVTLTRETYTMEEARISASRAGLLAALLRAGRSGRLASYRFEPARARELPNALGGRYAVLNPLREIATEAFYNWYQVQLLERETE